MRLLVAAFVGALALLGVDLAWIAFTFPDVIPRWFEAGALFVTLAPAAIGCGIVLAIAEGLVWLAVVETDRWLLRRGLTQRSHVAALTATVSIPPSLLLAVMSLSNTRARVSSQAILIVFAVSLAAGAVWFAVRVASQVVRTSPDRAPRAARGLNAAGALLAAAVGVAFVVSGSHGPGASIPAAAPWTATGCACRASVDGIGHRRNLKS